MEQDILTKIKKLLALAKSTTSTHEAKAAMEAATRLAEAHRLSLAEIESNKGDAESVGEDSEPLFECGKLFAWQTHMVSGLANAHGCCAYSVTTMVKGHFRREVYLFGRPTDMAIVRELWSYVVPALDRAWKRDKDKDYFINRHSWWFGAADGICDSVEQGKQAARKHATSTAIVLVDQRHEAALAAMKDAKPKMQFDKKARTVRADPSDYHRGKRAGKQVMEQRTRTQMEPPRPTEETASGQLGFGFHPAYNAPR